MALRVLVFGILLLTATGRLFGKAPELHLISEYLKGHSITDICVWKNRIWASTDQGLYRLDDNEAVHVAVPVKTNDRITSLYSGSPYSLICGTFQGDLLFVTQTNGSECQSVWSMKEIVGDVSFYVNCVAQNEHGIWLGTLEKGVLLYDPEKDTLMQFSLDYDEDTSGINVYGFETFDNGVTWAIGQDGLYFIMNVFGRKNELQYVKSNRLKDRPYAVHLAQGQTYVAYKKGAKNYLGAVKFGKHAFDLRITRRRELPKGFIRAVQVVAMNDCWVLTDKICHLVNDRVLEYYINPSENVGIRASDMLLFEGNLYVSTTDNGILRYDLKEKAIEKGQEERFDPNHLTLGKSLELDMVFFAPGDSTLSSASYHQLSGLVGVLQFDTTLYVHLSGHTARDGDDAYLLLLSKARAHAVANYLREKGISPQRIRTEGLGAHDLKIPANPRSPKNRRVEIRLER